MKRIVLVLILFIVLLLNACGGTERLTWQEQYDLGVKYLSESNYEEAIIAFTAAIEIDPKQALAYSERGQVYVLSGETKDNLTAAQADFEAALKLDEALTDAWLGLADVYIRRGEYDRALELLHQALEKNRGDQAIKDKITEMEAGSFIDGGGKTRRSSHFEDGHLVQYWLYDYDEAGNNIKTVCYLADGTVDSTATSAFDQRGLEVSCTTQQSNGKSSRVKTFEYDAVGRRTKETGITTYSESGEQHVYYTLITYDDMSGTETHDEYDGETDNLNYRFIIYHDENGVRTRAESYSVNENGDFYLDYYVEYTWNKDGSYGGFQHFQVAPKEEQTER